MAPDALFRGVRGAVARPGEGGQVAPPRRERAEAGEGCRRGSIPDPGARSGNSTARCSDSVPKQQNEC
eukprot:11724755-Alexandrium_andersonii.AAC.1